MKRELTYAIAFTAGLALAESANLYVNRYLDDYAHRIETNTMMNIKAQCDNVYALPITLGGMTRYNCTPVDMRVRRR